MCYIGHIGNKRCVLFYFVTLNFVDYAPNNTEFFEIKEKVHFYSQNVKLTIEIKSKKGAFTSKLHFPKQ